MDATWKNVIQVNGEIEIEKCQQVIIIIYCFSFTLSDSIEI